MSVLLSVPTRGSVRWETVTRLEEIRDAMHITEPILYQPGNLSVAQTRNKIVHKFLETDCDTLVMVDDDIVPSPHFLKNVQPLQADWGMVALPHPMPHPADPSRLMLTIYDDELTPIDPVDGLNECAYVATGCVAISREALWERSPFAIEDDPDWHITSDDFRFCLYLRGNGFKVGYWWDGWYADHVTTVSLAPLFERSIRMPLSV